MTVTWPAGQKKDNVRNPIGEFLKTRAPIPVTVLHVGDGFVFDTGVTLGSNSQSTVSAVRGALLNSGVGSGADRTVVLRPIFESTLPEGDPATFTYEIVDMHMANELEWWHFEVRPESDNLFWSGYADLLGLDAAVLEAPVVPKETDKPPTVPWVGGSARKRSQKPATKGTEPTNAPGREIVK
jgi:hypothetical protein